MARGKPKTSRLCISIALLLAMLAALAAFPAAGRPADADGWVQLAKNALGDTHAAMIMPTTVFQDKLYFSIPIMSGGEPAPIWAYDGSSFDRVADSGFGDANNNSVFPLAVYRDQLYAGTSNYAEGGQLWRTSNGTEWEQIGQEVFSAGSAGVQCTPLGVQDGKLLVGFDNPISGAQVWAFDGADFTRANQDGFGMGYTQLSMGATYKGKVHVIAYGTDGIGSPQNGDGPPTPSKPLMPLTWDGGKSWKTTAQAGFGDTNNFSSMILMTDSRRLCTGTYNPATGGEAWSYDGSSWTQVGSDGMGDASNTTAFAFPWAGKTYVSTSKITGAPSDIYRETADGEFEKWVSNGFGDVNNSMVMLTAYYEGYFIAGTNNNESGFQVWKAPTPPSDTYYFAEGTTRQNDLDGYFDEWLCIQNPNQTDVTVTVTYMMSDGSDSVEKEYAVPAASRHTVNVASDVGRDKDVSAKVEGSGPIIVERPMYFYFHGAWPGGHTVTGVPFPEKTWLFAEGTTRDNAADGSFAEYVCVQNPNDTAATVTFDYMLGDGTTEEVTRAIPAMSRHTEDVNADLGEGKDVSVLVDSDVPVVAERPIYFNYHNQWTGGHDTVGIVRPQTEYYFAEGSTYDWMQEWLCIQNPTDDEAQVDIHYYVAGGEDESETVVVGPTSRQTVNVAEAVGEDRDVSIYLSSDVPVVAERPIYFNYLYKWTGGHDVMGINSPKTRFYFAEGTTRQNDADGYFDEWLCIQNPDSTSAEVEITFMMPGGETETVNLTVPSSERQTYKVNQLIGNDQDASVYIESDTGIVVERPIYFNYHNAWPGGSDTIGVTYP